MSRDLAAQVRRAEPLDADIAVVVIGANDLARFVPPAQAAASLASAVTALRAAGTDVVVVPAPDMSSVPFVPPAFRAAVRAASLRLQQHQAAAVQAAGGSMAAVSEVNTAFAGDPAMFSADRFHPSSAGYGAIAHALAPAVLAVARVPPGRRRGLSLRGTRQDRWCTSGRRWTGVGMPSCRALSWSARKSE